MFCEIPVQHNNTLTGHNVEMMAGMYSKKISSASLCDCSKWVGILGAGGRGDVTSDYRGCAFTSSYRSKYSYAAILRGKTYCLWSTQ